MIDCKMKFSRFIGSVNRVMANFGHLQSHILSQIFKTQQARVQEFARGGAQNLKAFFFFFFFFAFQFFRGGPSSENS